MEFDDPTTPEEMLDAAIKLAQSGYKIFPLQGVVDLMCTCGDVFCKHEGKHPQKSSNGYRDATDDIEVIKRWWTLWPHANIGIATEASGVTVLDVDKEAGRRSLESFPPIDSSYITTGNGRHYYFKGVVRTLIGKVAPGIDIRSRASSINAPPSNHPSARVYSGSLAPPNELPEVPGWLMKKIDDLGEIITNPSDFTRPARKTEYLSSPTIDNVDRALAYVSRIDGAVAGAGGHDKTFHVALYCAKGFSLTYNEAWYVLNQYNQRCDPPWKEKELRHKLDDAYKSTRVPDGFKLGDGMDWSPPTRHRQITGEPPATEPEKVPQQWRLGNTINEERIFESEMLEPKWLIPELQLGPGRPCGLWGYGGTGKSYIAQAIALSLVSGKKVFDRFECKTGKVLHLSWEIGKRALLQRYRRLANGMGITSLSQLKGLNIAPFPRITNGEKEKPIYLNTKEAEEVFTGLGNEYDLIVMDSLRRALPGEDENSSSISNFLDILTRVSDRTDATIMVIHHSGKSGQDGNKKDVEAGRGSSAIQDGSGCIWLVKESENGYRKMCHTRTHDDGEGIEPSFYIHLDTNLIMESHWECSQQPSIVKWVPDSEAESKNQEIVEAIGEKTKRNIEKQIKRYLLKNPGSTKTMIRANIQGRNENISAVLEELEIKSQIRIETNGRATRYFDKPIIG